LKNKLLVSLELLILLAVLIYLPYYTNRVNNRQLKEALYKICVNGRTFREESNQRTGEHQDTDNAIHAIMDVLKSQKDIPPQLILRLQSAEERVTDNHYYKVPYNNCNKILK